MPARFESVYTAESVDTSWSRDRNTHSVWEGQQHADMNPCTLVCNRHISYRNDQQDTTV
jgi:hypothetical protein